jgi:hypothetical protein
MVINKLKDFSSFLKQTNKQTNNIKSLGFQALGVSLVVSNHEVWKFLQHTEPM